MLTIVINTTLSPEISAHSIKLPSDRKGNQMKLNVQIQDENSKFKCGGRLFGILRASAKPLHLTLLVICEEQINHHHLHAAPVARFVSAIMRPSVR